MKIRLLKDGVPIPGVCCTHAGQSYECPVGLAMEHIYDGLAEDAEPPKVEIIENREPEIETRDPEPEPVTSTKKKRKYER